MKITITATQVAAILRTNKNSQEWHPLLIELLPKYKIDTTNRVAGFMAQCAHESRDFTALEENLNYSESALNRVFPRYFGPGKRNAAEYARNPEKIANYVYQDEFRSKRGALGNTQPGDGWRFRGGGIKQLTGRNNYEAFGKSIGTSPEKAADYVRTKRGALESACWFWNVNSLNAFADAKDIVGMSKRINGGTIGLEDRISRWNHALQVLSGESVAIELRRGSKGSDVAVVQKIIGVTADGDFGPATESALKKWQKDNQLPITGVVDFVTRNALFS